MHIHDSFDAVLKQSPVIAFGTTAVHPFISSLEGHLDGAVILHTSLRDLTEEVILQADNVVDDIDQVCSNNTSLHLAEKQVGNRDFIRTAIGDIFNGEADGYDSNSNLHIFSPFGLGILDMAFANWVEQKARTKGIGTQIDQFLPASWLERG